MLLVVPCYNEEHRLCIADFVGFLHHHPDIGLQFVDDGSSDNTVVVLEKMRADVGAKVRILALASNGGKGEAVRRGLCAALEIEPRMIGFVDADLSTPLTELTAMAQTLDTRSGVLLVIGSRIPMLGRQILRSRSRYLAGRLLGLLAYPVLGAVLHDTQCGAKLLRVTVQTAELLAEPFLNRWIFDIELLVRVRHLAQAQGRRLSDVVVEAPLTEWQERGGTKVRLTDYLWSSFALLRMGLRNWLARR